MAEQTPKQAGAITIVAVERGFLGGAMVEPGAKIQWPADQKVPKWAAAKEDDPRIAKAKRVLTAADLKPQAINDAVRGKSEALRNEFT
ncbi:hypothetical protein [Castellaniella caeni]|uniref:hypothetical protein n=1 Tax=Castellaniella caeni TaxID=266123 RepID=UPI000C9F92BF|nr:hypothetical protein [Castellaniella caeni]